MNRNNAPQEANSSFALGQLSRALRAAVINRTNTAVAADAAEKAEARAAEWKKLAQGMALGCLTIGSRTPIAGVPEWVTPRVMQGGFATGDLLAEGSLLPHEEALLDRLDARGEANPRLFLNSYYLTEGGMREVRLDFTADPDSAAAHFTGKQMLPYERDRGRYLDSSLVSDVLQPWFTRLRFYPVPASAPQAVSSIVSVAKIGEVKSSLSCVHEPPAVVLLKRSLGVWRPLEDEFIALFLETLGAGESAPIATRVAPAATVTQAPAAVVTPVEVVAKAQVVKQPSESVPGPTVSGGTPCQVFPSGWNAKAIALLARYDAEVLSGAPPSKHPNVVILMKFALKVVKQNAKLTDGEIRRLRRIIAEVNMSRGLPFSEKLTRLRANQKIEYASHAAAVLLRMKDLVDSEGIDNIMPLLAPITEEEAKRIAGLKVGTVLNAGVVNRVQRARQEDLYELVNLGLVPSAEVLAKLLPQISSQTRSTAITDVALRYLYNLLYIAFRQRRSLCLFVLGGQVALHNLPWVKPIEEIRKKSPVRNVADSSREALTQVAMVAFEAFPETIIPNKLLKELHAFVTATQLSLPLVDELAVDIFQGEFGAKFVTAAARSASYMHNKLYAKYYNLPCDELLALGDQIAKGGSGSQEACKAFFDMCLARSGLQPPPAPKGGRHYFHYRSPAENGTIVEQEQILTTHNLGCLFATLGLDDRFGARLCELPCKCLKFIMKSLSILPSDNWRAILQTIKNVAYAWRQMVFFASLLTAQQRAEFFDVCRQALEDLKDQNGLRVRLQPAFDSLFAADQGKPVTRLFLGWTLTRHWVLAPKADPNKPPIVPGVAKLV